MKEGDQLSRPHNICSHVSQPDNKYTSVQRIQAWPAACFAATQSVPCWSAGEDVPHHHQQPPLHLLAALLPGHRGQGRALLETGLPGPRWPQEEILIIHVHLQSGCLYSQRSSTIGSENFAKFR